MHQRLERTHCQARADRVNKGQPVDWATAEALAVGSLLIEGNNTSSQLPRKCSFSVSDNVLSPRFRTGLERDKPEQNRGLMEINWRVAGKDL